MPVKATNAQGAKGVKNSKTHKKTSKSVKHGKTTGATAKSKTTKTTKTVGKNSTVAATTVTKKSAPMNSTTFTKATSKSVQTIPDNNHNRSDHKLRMKQKGAKMTKIHPEVEKLVEMLTMKMNLTQNKTPAHQTDNQCSEETESDESSQSGEDSSSSYESDSSDCSCSDCSSSCDCSDDDDNDEDDDSSDSNDSYDDISSCSGCSNCGLDSTDNTDSDNTDPTSSESNYESSDDCVSIDNLNGLLKLEETDGSVVVAKLKRKPLRKRTKKTKSEVKSKSNKKKSIIPKKKTKKSTNSNSTKSKVKSKKPAQPDVKRLIKPTIVNKNVSSERPLKKHELNLSTLKTEHKMHHKIKTELPSTSYACAWSSHGLNVKNSPKEATTSTHYSNSMMHLTLPKIEPNTPITPPRRSKGACCNLPKANSTFKKVVTKSSKTCSNVKRH